MAAVSWGDPRGRTGGQRTRGSAVSVRGSREPFGWPRPCEDAVWKRPDWATAVGASHRRASALNCWRDEHLYDVDFRSATCRPRQAAVSDTATKLWQNCAKTRSVDTAWVSFRAKSRFPILLETLKTESKRWSRWKPLRFLGRRGSRVRITPPRPINSKHKPRNMGSHFPRGVGWNSHKIELRGRCG